MKRKLLYTAWAIGALFTACSSEEIFDDPNQDIRKEVKLEIAGSVSRTTTTGSSTTFVEGDVIGISSSGLDMDMNNAKYTVGNNGELTGGVFYYDGNNKATFYAHYPYSATYSVGKVAMTVPSKQATEAAFNAADFMTATAIGDPAENGAVKLQFKHRLALVKVVWSTSTTANNILLKNVKPTTTWTQSTDACVTSGEPIEINMWEQGSKQEFWALIPEQTIDKGTELLLINAGSKDYTYTLTDNIVFSASAVKKITLSLKPSGGGNSGSGGDNSESGGENDDYYVDAIISNLEIGDWGDENQQLSGTVEETVLPPHVLISENVGKFKNITQLTPLTKKTAIAGVWGFDAADNATIELTTCPVDNAEKAIHINVPTKANWWEDAVYYRLEESAASGIKKDKLYELKFKVRSNTADKLQLRLHVLQAEKDNHYFAITQENNKDKALDATYESNGTKWYWLGAQYPFTNAADTYEEKTYYVSFNKDLKATNGSETNEYPVTNSDSFDSVAICFAVNTGHGVDFYIKDITLIEVK